MAWLEKNGFSGFDPYDIKSHRMVLSLSEKSSHSKILVVIRELAFEIFYSFPVCSRRLLHIKPEINAKAMGLFASAYLKLYQLYHREKYLAKAEECLEWLIQNKVETSDGIGWGYPFHWQSARQIPAFTPNGIVSTAAGAAFWEFYRYTDDQKYLEYCKQIAGFLNALPVDTVKGNICFSYTPLYINHVHNLNLFVAEFLIKIGLETGNKEWIERGNRAVNYTILNQNADGSFDYNGPPEKPQKYIDHYHTGFVLRMLHSTWKLTGRQDIFDALQKSYHHYRNHFFEKERIPKLMPHRKYRIDIHSSAESINCLSELSTTFHDSMALAEKVLCWTIDNLQSKEGYFYYGILRSRFTGLPFKSKIPYIRWGQAWMLKSISNYLYFRDQFEFERKKQDE
ncbi:MAG: hypothetical protein JXA39_02315 [Bacteroidales bacterium]|nr:hypothetical protein [Bacteroidales bacterium]